MGDVPGDASGDVPGDEVNEPAPEGGAGAALSAEHAAKGVPQEMSESCRTFSRGWNHELEHSACGHERSGEKDRAGSREATGRSGQVRARGRPAGDVLRGQTKRNGASSVDVPAPLAGSDTSPHRCCCCPRWS